MKMWHSLYEWACWYLQWRQSKVGHLIFSSLIWLCGTLDSSLDHLSEKPRPLFPPIVEDTLQLCLCKKSDRYQLKSPNTMYKCRMRGLPPEKKSQLGCEGMTAGDERHNLTASVTVNRSKLNTRISLITYTARFLISYINVIQGKKCMWSIESRTVFSS